MVSSTTPSPAAHGTHEFLCERCGYVLEGLDLAHGACPECGQPARDSMPARRAGTPWQRGPSPLSYARTVYVVLGFPLTFWRDVRFTGARAATLLATTLVTSGAAASFATLAGVAGWRYALWFWLGFTIVITVLTMIEMAGLYVFGKRRSFRMTGNVPFVICAHAASAWWIAAIGMGLVSQIAQFLVRAQLPAGAWLSTPRTFIIWDVAPMVFFVVAAFLAGMVSYSLLAGAGFHALRHVNLSNGTAPPR